MVSINERRTGRYAIVKEENGVYTVIYGGQDIPPYNLMTQNNVPQDLYGECYND